MMIFQSYRSTLNGFVRGDRADRYHILEDPITGAPVGLQSPRGNGPQGLWAPTDLSAAQIASPTAAMIADLNATFRLNVAPYTRYRSDGTSLVEVLSSSVAGTLNVAGAIQFDSTVRLDGNMTSAGIMLVQGAARFDPSERSNGILTNNAIAYTADNVQDGQSILAQLYLYPQGHKVGGPHIGALMGICAPAAGTPDSGTVNNLNGVISNVYNTTGCAVTIASAYRVRPPFPLTTGSITSYYGFYQEPYSIGSGIYATNVYGGYFHAPVGAGTTAPVYGFDDALGVGIRTSAYFVGGVANALTAAGTTRADALALTKQRNVISTATASTGVVLPSAATVGIGGWVDIDHKGASPIKVYGAGSDTIDAAAGATGVTLTNAKRCRYSVDATATWVSAQWGVPSA